MIKREDFLNKITDYVLLMGAILSVVLLVTGVILLAVQSSGPIPFLIGKNLHEVFASAFQFQSSGILNLGVLVLMATPFFRVIACVIGFAFLRWWRFTFVSLIVLGLLTISITVIA